MRVRGDGFGHLSWSQGRFEVLTSVHRDTHHTHHGPPMFCCGSRTVPWGVSRSCLYAQGPVGTS